MIGVPCTSFFFFSEVLGRMWLNTKWVAKVRFMKLFFGEFFC